jgi:hypothetical protein
VLRISVTTDAANERRSCASSALRAPIVPLWYLGASRLACVLVVALCIAGCHGHEACGGNPTVSRAEGAPVIDDASVVSQLAQDSWTVVVGIDYEDSDGDLSQGNIVFYLNDSSTGASTQPLAPAFKQSAIPEGTPSGQLIVPVRFDDSGIKDDASVDLGLQLVDGARMYSNCYGLTLKFEVSDQ